MKIGIALALVIRVPDRGGGAVRLSIAAVALSYLERLGAERQRAAVRPSNVTRAATPVSDHMPAGQAGIRHNVRERERRIRPKRRIIEAPARGDERAISR